MADEEAAKVETTTTETKVDKKSNKKFPVFPIIGAAILIAVAVVLCVVLGGNKVVGKYNLYAYIQNDEENTSMVELLKSFGMNITVDFKDNKTGVLETVGGDETNKQEFTYDDKKITIKNGSNTEETEYKLDGDYVTITVGDEKMKFKRDGK